VDPSLQREPRHRGLQHASALPGAGAAERIAKRRGITRDEVDGLGLASQRNAARAVAEQRFEREIAPVEVPVVGPNGATGERTVVRADQGPRPSTAEGLAKLKPVLPDGIHTAGNSSQITDGASWVILASEKAVKEHGLTPRAVIVDSQWSALDPSIMGLGPVLCATAILRRHGLALGDVGLWELNEAFAAQVLACLAAWEDDKFCREALGLEGAAGRIERDKLNVDGGAIGLGHPVGASGNRIVLHLVNAMKRLGVKQGIATECIGGGQGGAMLIETV
jgi:acetyl-CoA C-acetyltransferase